MSTIKNFTGYGLDQGRFRKEAKKSITREIARVESDFSSLSKLPTVSLLSYSSDINSTVSINNASRKLNEFIKNGNDTISGMQTASDALDRVMENLEKLENALDSGNVDSFKKFSKSVFGEIDDLLKDSSYNGEKVFEKAVPGTPVKFGSFPNLFMSPQDEVYAENGLDASNEKGLIKARAVLDHAKKQIMGEKESISTRINEAAETLNEALSRSEVMFSAGMDHFDLQLISGNYDSARFQILSNPGELIKVHNFSSTATQSLL